MNETERNLVVGEVYVFQEDGCNMHVRVLGSKLLGDTLALRLQAVKTITPSKRGESIPDGEVFVVEKVNFYLHPAYGGWQVHPLYENF